MSLYRRKKTAPELSKTEVRRGNEKTSVLDQYHKSCLEEFVPEKKTVPELSRTEVR
jgi:hypothetical protein